MSATSVDAALSDLRARRPDYRISTMGERPAGSLRDPFFCAIERRTGGGLYLGEGKTLAAAIVNAVGLTSP